MTKSIEEIWQFLNEQQARMEAMETLLIACVPLLCDAPAFAAALEAGNNARLADRLNRNVDDAFISAYQNHLIALLPPHLRPLLQ